MSKFNPTRSAANTAGIILFLRKLQSQHQVNTYAAIVGGSIVSLVGPLCILLFYTLFSLTLISSYGFFRAYGIVCAITLPISFAMAWYLRGSVLEHWIPDDDTLSGRLMRRTVAPMLIILEIANAGPRLMIWGYERFMGQARVHGAGLPRIAEAVVVLLKTDSSISPAALLKPGESPDELSPLLAYLLYYQLVDLSKQGDRVWLVTHMRNRLVEFLRV